MAREIWNDEALASKPEAQAAELKRCFNQDFWIPDRQFLALHLDRDKKKVDSLSSKIGQLLWSGIVNDEKARDVKHCSSDAISRGLSACIAGYD